VFINSCTVGGFELLTLDVPLCALVTLSQQVPSLMQRSSPTGAEEEEDEEEEEEETLEEALLKPAASPARAKQSSQ
jgi:hypothetical protein